MNIIRRLSNYQPIIRSFSSNISKENKKKICIVGAGPAGFYASQYLLKHLDNCEVHLLEKLPVPFGLVRFGVAPDHPEVKNVINTFTKTAQSKNFKFYGNVELGKNLSLNELRDCYHAVILTYGASLDRKLGIPNEDIKNVLSAREFVAWYNGLPGAENLNPNLDGETVSIIGQGNVAIDAARILLAPIDLLKKTDITEFSLEKLAKSKVQSVNMIGRRGPLQAAFTIAELREMLKLPNVNTVWRNDDFKDVKNHIPDLKRPRKRITELMINSLENPRKTKTGEKQFNPIFLRSPLKFSENGVNCSINYMENEKAISTESTEFFESDLILTSIGYKSICCDKDINFNSKSGHVNNKSGRVLLKDENEVDKGLYVAGWLATGPTGVILTTMNGAFMVAKNVCEDFKSNFIDGNIQKPDINFKNYNVVDWNLWKKIDKYEIEKGKSLGKPREKIVDINEMLEVAGI